MEETAETKLLFSDSDLKLLIYPLLLEQTLNITVGLADSMMVSSAGEAAISGVSLVDMINILIFSVLSALATGGSVVTSQYLGADNRNKACKSSRQLILVSLFFGTVIMALSMAFSHGLLSLFFGSIEEDVMDAALTYFLITAASYPFLAIYQSCAALFRAMGNSKVTFRVSVIMNIINIAGNAICIFGLHMGVAGVAWPSFASRVVAALILYLMLLNEKYEIHFLKGPAKPDMKEIRRILYIGIPSGIENGLFQLGRVLVVSIIATFGTVQIAANGVANSLDSFGCIVGNSFCLAMITVIGRCVGAGDEKQIRMYTKKLLKLNYILSAVIIIPMILFLKQIISIYNISEEARYLAWQLVLIHNGIAMFLWPLAFVLPNMLRAANDVKYTMTVSVASMAVFRIGFSVILGINMGMGAIGVWIAMIIDWICRILFFVGRYFKGTWKKYAGLEAKPCSGRK